MNPSSRRVPLTTADPLGGRRELCKPVCLLDPVKEGDAYIPKEEQRKVLKEEYFKDQAYYWQ